MKENKRDPNGRHIRVYVTQIDSPAWRVLSPSAVKLFVDMRASLTGTNNGNISATLSDMKHRGWKSSATLAKALYELRALGFLAVTREGGLKMGTRVCTLYRFTDRETFEQPKLGVSYCKATFDFRAFATVRDAERALVEGTNKLRAEGAKKQTSKKKTPVHKTTGIASKVEPDAEFIASESELAEPA